MAGWMIWLRRRSRWKVHRHSPKIDGTALHCAALHSSNNQGLDARRRSIAHLSCIVHLETRRHL